MKLKKVWLMCGIPGSGKSTWIQKEIANHGGVWCSRDAVRFSMLSDSDEYFAHEDEVFLQWIETIKEALQNPDVENIYVDATHLNDRSRNKVLNCLPKDNIDEIINVVFQVPIHIAIERNEKREGREKVPKSVIRRMFYSFQMPSENRTIIINQKGEIVNE